jgi:hypothetical protein
LGHLADAAPAAKPIQCACPAASAKCPKWAKAGIGIKQNKTVSIRTSFPFKRERKGGAY